MANHYIRDGGSGDGSSWTSAWDDLPATFVRGDTYYVADGAYGTHTFNTAVSGSTYITIKKAVGNIGEAGHGTDDGWDSSYGDGQAVFSGTTGAGVLNFDSNYWIFTGQSRTTWTSGHGFKVSYGSSGDGVGIAISSSYVTVSYCEIVGPGLDTNVRDNAVWFYDNGSYRTLEYSYIYNANGTTDIGHGSSHDTIQYNYYGPMWSAACCHSEPFASDAGTSYITIRYNKYIDCEGTGHIVVLSRGWPAGYADYYYIYGNLFQSTDSNPSGRNDGIGNGSIAIINSHIARYWYIYNNTWINGYQRSSTFRVQQQSGTATQLLVYNNLYYSSQPGADATHYGVTAADYNFYMNYSHTTETHEDGNASAVPGIFVSYGDSGDFHLTSTYLTYSNDHGLNVGSPYNIDMDGVTRGGDGIWDHGAYEYVSGGDVTAPVVTISTSDPTIITANTLYIEGTATDAVGVTECKYRIGAAPDATHGTALAGTNSWSGTAIGFSPGVNTLYVGAADAAGNWGTDSMTVNYNVGVPHAPRNVQLAKNTRRTSPKT